MPSSSSACIGDQGALVYAVILNASMGIQVVWFMSSSSNACIGDPGVALVYAVILKCLYWDTGGLVYVVILKCFYWGSGWFGLCRHPKCLYGDPGGLVYVVILKCLYWGSRCCFGFYAFV